MRENNYWTRVESLPLGDSESRVDIEIESPAFIIFIEAKIWAPESGDQLRRYCELARLKAAGRPWTVMFLTVDGRKPQDAEQHATIVPISWKLVANVLDDYANSHSVAEISNRLFRQFSDHIRNLP